MGNASLKETVQAASNTIIADSEKPAKPKCKACCACPETKKARDAWYVFSFSIISYIFKDTT